MISYISQFSKELIDEYIDWSIVFMVLSFVVFKKKMNISMERGIKQKDEMRKKNRKIKP